MGNQICIVHDWQIIVFIFVEGAIVEIKYYGLSPDSVHWAALRFKGQAAWTVWLKDYFTNKLSQTKHHKKRFVNSTSGKAWPSRWWLFWGLTTHKSSFNRIIYVVINHKMGAFRRLDCGVCGLKDGFRLKICISICHLCENIQSWPNYSTNQETLIITHGTKQMKKLFFTSTC